jgi:hypothetical protein
MLGTTRRLKSLKQRWHHDVHCIKLILTYSAAVALMVLGMVVSYWYLRWETWRSERKKK